MYQVIRGAFAPVARPHRAGYACPGEVIATGAKARLLTSIHAVQGQSENVLGNGPKTAATRFFQRRHSQPSPRSPKRVQAGL